MAGPCYFKILLQLRMLSIKLLCFVMQKGFKSNHVLSVAYSAIWVFVSAAHYTGLLQFVGIENWSSLSGPQKMLMLFFYLFH